jgi:hypothetical protein
MCIHRFEAAWPQTPLHPSNCNRYHAFYCRHCSVVSQIFSVVVYVYIIFGAVSWPAGWFRQIKSAFIMAEHLRTKRH